MSDGLRPLRPDATSPRHTSSSTLSRSSSARSHLGSLQAAVDVRDRGEKHIGSLPCHPAARLGSLDEPVRTRPTCSREQHGAGAWTFPGGADSTHPPRALSPLPEWVGIRQWRRRRTWHVRARDAVHGLGRVRVRQHRERDRVGVDVERVVVVVRERVAGGVVARVELRTHGAAPDRLLLGGLGTSAPVKRPPAGMSLLMNAW